MAFSRDNVARATRQRAHPPDLVGESAAVDRLWSRIDVAARRASTILIQGESGTGKELIARHIHAASPRSTGPFVPVDCTTLRDTLFESQLFGHVKGAFTGAEYETLGFFRSADGGTLFLDEIGELELHVQAKLLRCIQDRQVIPLGGVDPIPIDIRIVTATHRDLKAMVHAGSFRQDLFYRLNVVRLRAPALRDRRSDIGLLAEHFLVHFAEVYDEPLKTLTATAIEALEAYEWPGNVRELANIIEQAHVFSKGCHIAVDDLPAELRETIVDHADGGGRVIPLEKAERQLIARALRAADGNQAQAARMLEIDRRRLYRKVRQHQLQSLVHRPTG